MSDRPRFPWAALGFALAAAFSSWNPVSAPFGLPVGLVSLVLAVRSVRRGDRRGPAVAAAVTSAVAVLASALVLALTAGVGRDLAGTEIVPAPTSGEVSQQLDAAAERTRASRERARSELGALDGSKGEGAARRTERGK